MTAESFFGAVGDDVIRADQRGRTVLALGLASLPAIALGTAAESPEDGARPSSAPPGVFHLNFSEMYLGFETEYQGRRVRSSVPRRRDTTQENTDLRFTESLGLRLDGDMVDPDLLEWSAGLEFGLTQSHFREEWGPFQQSDRDSGVLLEYDFSLTALKSRPVSINAYARRHDDRIPRRFLPSLKQTQTEAGVSVLGLFGPVTTEFGFSWDDTDRSGNRLVEDDESLRRSRFYANTAWEISDAHRLRLSYDHERERNTYQGSIFGFDTNRDEVRVEHELAFGAESQHRLDTTFRVNEERGDLARDETSLVTRLSLQHTSQLKTVARYSLYRFSQGGVDVDQHKFDLEGLYQPTKNLRLSLNGYALHEAVDDDADTNEYGGGADFAYHRPTSLGEWSVNAALAFDRARTVGDAGRRVVRSEAHALGSVRPVFLNNRRVVWHSILAHNDAFTRVYVSGVDYIVAVLAGRAVVRRVPTGRIAENEVVYFDYEYEVPTYATVDATRTDLLVEHSFNFGLTPYYDFEGRFEEVDASVGTPRYRDHTDRHRMGLRFEKERWSGGAEYEIFDDSVEPYDAWHLTGRAALVRRDRHTLDLTAELSRYFFEGGIDRRHVWWFDVAVKDRAALGDHLSVDTGLEYRWEHDSVNGKTNGIDAECSLVYARGYLKVELTVEYDLLSIVDNREDGFGLFLNLRRDLSHLFTKRMGTP